MNAKVENNFSVLPTIGKVLEKLLTQRLNFHLEKNNRLSNLQYGFREGRPTEMAITKLLDTIHKGKASGVITREILGSSPESSKDPLENSIRTGAWGSRLVSRTYRPNRQKTLNNSTSVPSGNFRCLQDNLHGSSADHIGYPSSSSTITREARGTTLFKLRLPLSTNISDIYPSEIKEKATGWTEHPSEHLIPTLISLDDGGNIKTGLRIYIDGSKSKTEKGVGAAFCVLTDVNITHRWSTRFSFRNTVFQAKILALLKAVEHAVALPTQQRTILVDTQASIKSAVNPKSHNSIARKIFKFLHSHPHISVSWIKAHAGYIGTKKQTD
ncbi:hypothetical protein AVEN_142346-1 [Araneus ventricosus]|uniref:RNase H type-1 domain-containing protein n=1 Tax=Araneus ventricosus TaxID=182803 RepID=A0A4Y2GAX1_ARAVE|nr:hypothetical protein AVEN_142346-1 [Araneus ventricosus]